MTMLIVASPAIQLTPPGRIGSAIRSRWVRHRVAVTTMSTVISQPGSPVVSAVQAKMADQPMLIATAASTGPVQAGGAMLMTAAAPPMTATAVRIAAPQSAVTRSSALFAGRRSTRSLMDTSTWHHAWPAVATSVRLTVELPSGGGR